MSENGSVKLYHPSGATVTLAVPQFASGSKEVDYKLPLAWVQGYLDAGFLVNPPGLEAGEQKAEALYVVRREVADRDGEVTPVVDLYAAEDGQNRYKMLKVYLNTDDDVAAFERASGLALSAMTRYDGTGDIDRQSNNRNLLKLVYRAPRPFQVIFKPNPKYDADAAKAAKPGEYMVPKKKFVRWGEARPVPPKKDERPRDFSSDVAEWKKWFAEDHSLPEITDKVLEATKTRGLIAAVKPVVDAWMAETGCEWDGENKCFFPPRDPEDLPDETEETEDTGVTGADGDPVPF